MTGDPLDRFRFDVRRDPAVEPAGFDEFGDDGPARRPLRESGAGCEDELRVAGAGVVPGVTFPQPDVRQQASGQRGMDAGWGGVLVRLPDADVAGDAAQLSGEILPLADPQIVQELLAAHPSESVA
jgi:hypothetical protein